MGRGATVCLVRGRAQREEALKGESYEGLKTTDPPCCGAWPALAHRKREGDVMRKLPQVPGGLRCP